MAAPISEIASVTVTLEAAALTQAGFGIPLILSRQSSPFAGARVLTYTRLTDVGTDFGTTSVEYRMATELFAQSPRPEIVYFGRCANLPTQRFAITPVAGNATTYTMTLENAAGDSVECSFLSDGDATLAEIIAGLKSDIDGASLDVTVSDQTTYMRVIADNAGDWFSVESTSSPISNLLVEQDHTTSNISADLDAILLENADWYCILNPFNSTADVTAIATWAESNEKLFVAQTQQTTVATVSGGSDTTSIAAVLETAARERTALVYHENTGAFLDAALAGKCLPKDVGTETWALKTLSLTEGASTLTSTHITNLKAKNCGYYTGIGNTFATFEGKTSSGGYIDVLRLRDAIKSDMQVDVANLLLSNDKVPYTNPGIHLVAATVRGVLDKYVRSGGITPEYLVTVPDIADVSDADKTARVLNDVEFDFTITGAIQKVNVSGRASV